MTTKPSDPIEDLKSEHRVIERVLDALDSAAGSLGSEAAFPKTFFEEALDFFSNFADRCHHGKEEDRLFPLLKQRGIAEEGGPIGVMLSEHEAGRSHLDKIREQIESAEQGDPEAVACLRAEAAAYSALLRQHIRKEDDILFAMARRVLTREDMVQLRGQFECAEKHHMGEGVHERYEALAERLSPHSALPASP